MLFADDIIFIAETKDEVNNRLERCRHTVESRGFKLHRPKTEYLKCGSSGREKGDGEVTIDGVATPRVEKFKYLGSIIQKKKKGDIDEDINQRRKVG